MQNIEDIMKMAQEAQVRLLEEQAKLEKIEVEGASGGGMVKVRATAKGRVVAVSIDDALMGDKQMLEDLLAAAFNDARVKAEAVGAESMSQAMGGMQMPPGFKMPF